MIRKASLLEIALVTIATLVVLGIFRNAFINLDFILPCVLAAAALLPTLLNHRKITHIGLNLNQLARSFRLLTLTCLTILPLTFLGLFIMKHLNLPFPLRPTVPQGNWPSWLFYQFLYIALAEELFFRGYLLGNLLLLFPASGTGFGRIGPGMTVIISAFLFAGAHLILLATPMALLTFFPALIFSWLFLRTRSLLAPVLFHAIANIFYAFVTSLL